MKIFPFLLRKLRQLGNNILPTQCLLCDCTLYDELLCEGCTLDLPWIEQSKYRCKQCALALESESDYCGHCLKQPPAFDRCNITFAYTHPLTHLIHDFKYRKTLASGKLLGHFMAQHIRHCAATQPGWQEPDFMIPTPIHWSRRWLRGFNQTEILSEYIASETNIKFHTHIIMRRKRTPSQKELTRFERQKNLREAFFISDQAKKLVNNKRVALIDDVVTTTATIRELSQLLKKAGAKEVYVWALARTMEK